MLQNHLNLTLTSHIKLRHPRHRNRRKPHRRPLRRTFKRLNNSPHTNPHNSNVIHRHHSRSTRRSQPNLPVTNHRRRQRRLNLITSLNRNSSTNNSRRNLRQKVPIKQHTRYPESVLHSTPNHTYLHSQEGHLADQKQQIRLHVTVRQSHSTTTHPTYVYYYVYVYTPTHKMKRI